MKRTGKRENRINNKRLKHFIAAVAGLFAVFAGLVAIGSLLKRKRPCQNAQADEKKEKSRKKEIAQEHKGKISKENGRESAIECNEDSGKSNVRKFSDGKHKNSDKKNDKQNSKKSQNNKNTYSNNNGRIYYRKRLKHSLMAAAAGILAVSLIVVSVLTRAIEAEAAETFFGIEKLRNQVAESDREYTILEIVPDRSAAEIGYLFGGFEPILSEWDRDEMKWRSWKEILCSFLTLEERTKFIEDKKIELQAYYESLELKDKFPVQWGQGTYEESETPQEGFEKCEAEGKERRGWFIRFTEGSGIAERYRLSFGLRGSYSSVGQQQGVVYYVVDTAVKITPEMAETLSPDTVIYRKLGDGIFVDPQTWAEMLEKGINIVNETEETETETTTEEATTKEDGTAVETEEETTVEETETVTLDEGTTEESSTVGDTEESTSTEPADTENPEETSNPESSEPGSTDSGNTETGNPEESSSPEQSNPSEESSSPASPAESDNGENSGGNQNTGDQNGEQPAEPENAASEIAVRSHIWDRLSAEIADGVSPESPENPQSPEAGGDVGDNSGTPAEGGAGGDAGTPEESGGADGSTGTPEESSSEGESTGTSEESSSTEEGTETPEEGDGTEAGTETETESGTKAEPITGVDSEIKADEAGEESEEGGYYIVTFKRVENYGSLAADTQVYTVENIVADGSGEYQFIESDDESANAQIYFFEGIVIYCKNAFTNNEWFKKYVLNMEESDYENFPVKIITLTPEELNSMEQLPVFDFLYLNSGMRRTVISEVSNAVNNAAGGIGDIGHVGIGKDAIGESDTGVVNGNNGSTGDGNSGSTGETGAGGSNDGTGDTGNTETNEGSDNSGGSGNNGNGGSTGNPGNNGNGNDTGDNGSDSNGGASDPGNNGNGNGTGGTGNGDGTGSTGTDESSDVTGSTEAGGNGDDAESTETNETGETVDGIENDGAGSEETTTEETDAGNGAGGTEGGSTGNGNTGSTQVGNDMEVQYAAGGCDLSEAAARRLLERVIVDALPCLVDGSILYRSDENDGTVVNTAQKNTWVFKLAAVMCQESLPVWLEEHTSGISGISVDTLLEEMVEDDDYNFTTEQVYCKFGESIINSDFFTPTIYKEGGEMEQGFQNVLDEIELENLFRASDTSGNYNPLPTNISQAEALRHIINYKNRRSVETKKHIKVLEIQPAKADEPELTLEQLQKWAPGVETADITVMTTAEFIGKIEKLNEIYDLVYIGTSKDHLNMRYWTDKEYTGKPSDTKIAAGTVFNDSDMDGLIYYNIGDKRVVTLPLGGLLTTEYWGGNRSDWTYFYNVVRYGGNDITEEKMNALLSFLNGAYPVIIADDFIEQPMTVFSETDYAGYRVNLSTGEYKDLRTLSDHGIVASEISSLKVKDGYQVTVYSGQQFGGEKATFTADVSNLEQRFKGSISSIKVEKRDDSSPVRAIDGDHIDNCTYLYEFVEKALEDKYTNFYAWSDVQDGSELFKFYLNRPKASMIQTSANGNKQNGSDIYYISQGPNGKYSLEYHFTIQNEGAASMDTRYHCELYIDVNSDGKYSSQEQVSDITLTQNGILVSADELYAGREYVLQREVPNGYKGLLPWRVEVTQVNNDNIYASMSGYTKLMGMDQEILKICQINKDGSDVINLNYEVNTKGRYFNTLIYGGYYNGEYYPGITEDFDLDVTTINISEFERNFYKNPDYLNDFNMLILGFSDMYGDFSGTDTIGPMSAIVKFINSGKSVLLAHDTTSFFNSPGEGQDMRGYPWINNHNASVMPRDWYTRNAATLNKYIRPLVGMDRYGVLQSAVLQQGNVLRQGTADYEAVVNSGKDVAYKPKSGKTETVPEVHGYNYATVTSKSQKLMRDQGTTNDRQFTQYNLTGTGQLGGAGVVVFENLYKNIRYDNCYYWENWDGADTGELEMVRNGEVYNVRVTQTNKGQITEYPYKLKEEFEVAQTHAQYYELDYTADDDGDGQSDLVVWYCLGGRNSPTGNSAWESTVYSQSPNDVRNNYYIYNKGNITYTGMGHARHFGGTGADGGWYTFEEAKLFINTMIASYQAGVKPPYVAVLEKGLPDTREIKTMYRYYDDANGISLSDEATAETYEKIYFTVQDVNFVKGSRSIATHVFYEAAGGSETITVGGVDIQVNRLADAMYNASDDSPVNANNLQSGGIYYIMVPKSVMQQCDSGLKFYFEAQSTITTNTTTANVYVTDKIYAQLEVLKAYLFELE